MNSPSKRVLLIIAAVGTALIVTSGYHWWRSRQEKKDTQRADAIAVLDQAKADQAAHDSVTRHALDSVNSHLTTVAATSVTGITHWDTVTKRIPVMVHDTIPGKFRTDSVYKDSAFAALPDSDKVKLLRAIGDRNNRVCADLRTTCQVFRDSATSLLEQRRIAIRTRDSLVTLWKQRFEDKPRRRCGLGGAGGYGAQSSAGVIRVGWGAVVGYACSL